jgi:hypothetical protein
MLLSRKLLSIPGGRLILIVVPWKPVAIAFGFLAALMMFSYFGSALIEGKNPFAPYGSVANRISPGQLGAHSAAEHKHKANAAKSD